MEKLATELRKLSHVSEAEVGFFKIANLPRPAQQIVTVKLNHRPSREAILKAAQKADFTINDAGSSRNIAAASSSLRQPFFLINQRTKGHREFTVSLNPALTSKQRERIKTFFSHLKPN